MMEISIDWILTFSLLMASLSVVENLNLLDSDFWLEV